LQRLRNTLQKPTKDPKSPQNLSDMPLVHHVYNFRESYSKHSPQAHRKKEPAHCKPLWLPCASQHDPSIYEAYGTRDHKFQ